MKHPLVTVFFLTYNRHSLYIHGLDSVLRQTFANFETIIFDNGSTPPITPPSHILSDSRFRVLRNDDNRTRRTKIHQLLSTIDTKYIAFLFDDDRWEPEKLSRQVEILENDNAIVGCFTHAALIDSNEHLLEEAPGRNNIFDQKNRSRSEWIAHFFNFGNCLCQPSSLLRTEAFKASSNITYHQLGDFATWVNMLAFGNFHVIQEPLTRFNCSADIGRESSMDQAKTHRLLYEQSRILHQFRKLPPSLLGPAFGSTADITPSEVPELLFKAALNCGTDPHFRFASELAEEHLAARIHEGSHVEASLWSERYAKASGKQASEMQDNLKKGIAFFHSGDIDAAQRSILCWVADNPNDPEAYFYLALCCAAQGMISESTSFIRATLLLDPERNDLLAQLGEYFLNRGYIKEGRLHLVEAISRQPELFPAYPALAEAMRIQNSHEEAIELLESVVRYPVPSQTGIILKLLDILSEQGDLERVVANCALTRQDLSLQGLGIRLQTRTNIKSQELRPALEQLNRQLCSILPASNTPHSRAASSKPLRVAFILSDFLRASVARHLELLLHHLPTEDFFTILVNNDANQPGNELCERSALLADTFIPASMMDDNLLVASLNELAPNVLIDLDGPGSKNRLGVVCRVDAPLKLSWSDIPPWGLHDVLQLSGEFLQSNSVTQVSALLLGELGEYQDLPAIEVLHQTHEAPRFACLTPPMRVSADTWDCYAGLLERVEEAILVINLGELGLPAQQRISSIFARHGINFNRLHFIQASNKEALCAIWNEVDIGLAPLHGDGDDALPTCLWMERPYVALSSPEPWSKRPVALLELAKQGDLVAKDRASYLDIAERLARTSFSSPKREWLRKSLLTNPEQFVSDFAKRLKIAINSL